MKRLRTAALAAVAIGGASLAMAGPAMAAEPGQTCQVHGNGGVGWFVSVSGPVGYTLYFPDYFYISGYGTSTTYFGHGNGHSNGYLDRSAINQATCYW